MSKYFSVFKNSLQQYFAYRLNFVLWRVRILVSILISYFLWQAIYSRQASIFSYNKSQMLTYIILISFINGIVLSTQTFKVAEEINSGYLSNFLIRPISYFGYNISRDLSDKLLNSLFSVIEIIAFILLLRPPIYIQTNTSTLLIFLFVVFLSSFLYFQINMLLSFIGFWSREVWAPRFIFSIIVAFLAGIYFPLDILPSPLYSFLQILPFTYLVFFPLKIYLGGASTFFLVKGLLITTGWIVIMMFILKAVWTRGLKIYTAEGK